MKRFILFFLCVSICQAISENTVDVFEFGETDGLVAFTKTGIIGLLEKNIKVPILLPPCMDISYLRVIVDNKVGPPKVDFDSEVNTVVIKYRQLQHSKSSYTIVAKAVTGNYCGKNVY